MNNEKNGLPRPVCTIVIPLYNYADKVERAIRSVMAQTITNFECMIVDDGSSDRPENVVPNIIANDRRFHFIQKPNGGVATARNAGVEAGTGKYICCLDADDALAPLFLEACVTYLEDHPEFDIAYTGLYYYKPDGVEGLSPWPGECVYDEALERKNQIPTCNVMRRSLWEKLGGQRQRYAPDGAGEEDAEMWIRCFAYGARAKKVTTAGLFLYSWQTGRVSGNSRHRMTDYLAWHPWSRDGKYPFPATFTPNNFSHPVRQYDEPLISVIIPVGPGHGKDILNALDSLDAQDFRRWEAVVIWDTDEDPAYILRTFPHIVFLDFRAGSPHGAGFARNRGVESSRAPLLLYLDADDWLTPDALSTLFSAWEKTGNAIYSDYIGKAIIDEEYAKKMEMEGRLLDFDQKTKVGTIAFKSADYDCEVAIQQPSPQTYIWNTVSTLVPRTWHKQIGGFDESMQSWEDWDYFLRLARAGKCFTRVERQLLIYRFYSGGRRDVGTREWSNLIKYLTEKYKGIKPMGCGCSQDKVNILHSATRNPGVQATSLNEGALNMSDSSFVMIKYLHPNSGQHRVIGPTTQTDYGYRGGGETFLVHISDVNANPNLFLRLPDPQEVVTQQVMEAFPDFEDTPDPGELEDIIEEVRTVEAIEPKPKPKATRRRRSTSKKA